MNTKIEHIDSYKRFQDSFPKKYLSLRRFTHDLTDRMYEEICKSGHYDSKNKKGRSLKSIGINWNLDPRGFPTAELEVRFSRQRARKTSYVASPLGKEEMIDILEAKRDQEFLPF